MLSTKNAIMKIFAIISSIGTILFDSKKQLRILEFEIARGLFVPAVFRYLGLPDSEMVYASARHDPGARFR